MSLNKILKLALNDVRLTARDRPAFLWMLVMPVALMWLFGQAASGPSGPPRITLTVLDRDGGWLAQEFVEELKDETVNLREMTLEEFEAEENKVRSLIIPEGFTEKVLAGEQQTLRFEKESGSSQEFGVAGQMHVVRSIVRTLGRLVEISAERGGEAVTGAAAEEEFRVLAGQEPLVTLDVSTAGQGRPVPRGFNQSVPGMLTMIVLMMTLIYGAVFLTIEKREGMLRRQVSLPVSRMQIYLGKLAGRVLIAGFQLIALVAAGRFLFGVSWGNAPLGLALVLVSFAIATSGLATLLGAVLSTPEQASAVGWILSMILAGLGGCWWPSEVMPPWLWNVAHALPTAWAMDAFHSLISWGRGTEAVLLPSAVLMGFGALFAVLGARFLRFT